MRMEQSPEQAIVQLQQEQADLRADLEELSHFVKGNGDPTKGLLWLVADQARLTANLTALHEANRQLIEKQSAALREDVKAQEAVLREDLQQQRADFLKVMGEHQDGGHYQRQSFGQRLAYRAIEQSVALVVTAVLILIVWGAASWVQRCAAATRAC